MGNLQSEVKGSKTGKPGKVKQLMKIRGKRRKSDDVSFTGVVPEDAEDEEETLKETKGEQLLVTDSWCKVNQDVTSPGGESSSDSIFADPLTPVGFSTEINQCYQSEDEEHFSAALNSFKLNHHKAKQNEVISQKLSKLGVSKTSHISLDGEGQESFESENVEVVKKEENEESGLGNSVLNVTGEDKEDACLPNRAKRFSDDVTNSGESISTRCV